MHAPTLFIGVPALHYVMGGGWELCTQSVIGKRIRGDRHRDEPTSDLTLPYLTLPYLKLVYSMPWYIILPYITLSRVANESLKHTNPQFS